MGKTKEYTNGEVTVVWKPDSCIHSAICVKGLGEVFRPNEKPWIKIDAASTDALVNQVKACPSGALSYYMNDEGDKEATSLETKVEVLENGPLLVYGTLKVTHKDGAEETKNRTTAFCRCGASQNKPYCDGAHVDLGFKG
ncbi:(4Fe-4S)-binding protein [Psychroserpens sp.]|uniref:(4Fe-4S)-binding protein n=1 Tax=Psychroserpens sp. TaxID=2020870 RepID=UPI001B03B64B|nr:(4Fe-4S)-binding protein [Psychroserpens sp.]MBO6605944.1 (4Fe-4S)-binding protein [Psychroserpens sp.]MBO6630955.1 (4Fe-4S)-binding protein [Psychroserpens sp.]MBO6652685.1 (4Fe-4S)-binding protein [Psychroserpens sp.]MBO6681543.1 (4Fe-4S)-binding protein [Psychroserpens sp.]MBO6749318.1 (4Fe-4S)-binding protein [Psychroserpens sp.]